MKTMSIQRTALDLAARRVGSTLTVRPAPRAEAVATQADAIERQLDEIQSTFGVRWEW